MPTTRAATGNSKPRIIAAVEEVVAPKKRGGTTKTKANTSKPRTKTVTSGRVSKPGPKPKAGGRTVHVKKTPAKQLKDKVAGKVEKVEGDVEGKPGKKVRTFWFGYREDGEA